MTIDVYFKAGSAETYTRTLAQHDKGARLRLIGITLPETFEVHFSNRRDGGFATIVPGKNYSVGIPDAYLDSGDYVYAWIYVHAHKPGSGYDMNTEAEVLSLHTNIYEDEIVPGHAATIYRIIVPVMRRPAPVTVPSAEEEETYVMPGSDSDDIYEYTPDGENLIISLKTN